jgi:hypothetical protein
MTLTEQLAKRINELRGLTYPSVGYLMWADIRGDGTYSPRLYEIVTEKGGVCISGLHHRSSRRRCAGLRLLIENLEARDLP